MMRRTGGSMSRTLVWVALCVPGLAFAGEKRDAVMDLLNAIDSPPREADWKALGDGVDAELMEIAVDTSVPTTRRGAAVTALQYYPTDTVRAFLEGRLASTDALVRRKAVYSLAAFGPSSVPKIAGALSDADVQLRIAAANALGTIADESAKAALRARQPIEGEKAVQDAI